MNIMQLNYDNYIKLDEPKLPIQPVTKAMIKAALDAPILSGVISDDMKLYTVDIMAKKATVPPPQE